MNNVEVSVITTVRDKDQFTKSARSIMGQSASFDYEYIIVDCGSKKQDVLAEVKAILPGSKSLKYVRYLRFDSPTFNRGRSCNVGFKYALGKWVLTFDCDLIVNTNYLAKLLDKAKKLTSCLWCLGTEKKSGKIRPWCGSGIMLVPIEIIYKINGYDESFSGYGEEDIDFRNRIERAEFRIIRIQDPAWTHLSHSDKERGKSQMCTRVHGGVNANRTRRMANDTAAVVSVNVMKDWGTALGRSIKCKELK